MTASAGVAVEVNLPEFRTSAALTLEMIWRERRKRVFCRPTSLSGNAFCNCVLMTFRKYVLGLLCLPAFFFSNCFSFCFLCMSVTPPCASLPHCVLVYLVLKLTHPRSPPLCDFSLLSRHFPPSHPAFLICLPPNPHPASPLSLTLHPTSSGSRA